MAVLSRGFDASALQERPNLRSVHILTGAFGQGLPTRDFWISPQHSLLAGSPVVQHMYNVDETLLCAAQLTMLLKICVDDKIKDVTDFHIVMAQHEILIAECTPTESFFCGPMAVKSLAPEARREIEEIFPESQAKGNAPLPARSIPNTKRQMRLIRRLRLNGKPILSDPLNSAA
jgi:hypothetical protein